MDTDLYYLSKSIPQYNSWKMRRLKAPSLKATDFQLVDDIVDKVVKKHLGSGYSVNGNYYYALDPIRDYIRERPLTPEECYKPSNGIKTLAKYYKAPIIFGTGGEIEDTSIFKKLWRDTGVAKDNYAPKEVFWEQKDWYFKPLSESIKEEVANLININKKQVMNKSEQTEGEKRVRKSFNPSGLKRVEDFKQKMADAIDALNETAEKVNAAPNTLIEGMDKGDFLRELATAKTQLQIASMCGVAALTHEVVFKTIGNE